MGTQAVKVFRDVYRDGLFMVRLKNKLLDDTYLQPEQVSSITAEVLQNIPYTADNWETMRDSDNQPINTAISVPLTALLAEPVPCVNDDGENDYYNFEWIFGPNIFPTFNRQNMIVIKFQLTDGKFFFSPRFVCTVI